MLISYWLRYAHIDVRPFQTGESVSIGSKTVGAAVGEKVGLSDELNVG